MRLLQRGDLVCRQAVELVTGYLEGSLSRPSRKRFERHLAVCPHCTAYLEQARDNQADRAADTRRPDAADAGGVHPPVPPLAFRAALTTVCIE